MAGTQFRDRVIADCHSHSLISWPGTPFRDHCSMRHDTAEKILGWQLNCSIRVLKGERCDLKIPGETTCIAGVIREVFITSARSNWSIYAKTSRRRYHNATITLARTLLLNHGVFVCRVGRLPYRLFPTGSLPRI
jgi:hypothetical protein